MRDGMPSQTRPTPSSRPTPPEWSWERPRDFWLGLAQCDKLEAVPVTAPYTRQDLQELGLTGVQFGAWRSALRTCLNTDLVGLKSAEAGTEKGRIFLVDGESYFVELDARESLPFAAGSLEWVYAEHFIEHVPLAEAIGWLAEVRRVLAPGGFVRLTTPDLRRYAESYLSKDEGFFAQHRDSLYAVGARPRMPQRRAFMMNLVFNYWGHCWIYDVEELTFALVEAGFAPDAVRACEFRQGVRPEVAQLDLEIRRPETLYVEATA
ncbi:MAG TPA: methyltransferase domain-containing protein [Pilimelia sp.]|nr:methyltransferase domain-containing protein [Pilimelia sp.]